MFQILLFLQHLDFRGWFSFLILTLKLLLSKFSAFLKYLKWGSSYFSCKPIHLPISTLNHCRYSFRKIFSLKRITSNVQIYPNTLKYLAFNKVVCNIVAEHSCFCFDVGLGMECYFQRTMLSALPVLDSEDWGLMKEKSGSVHLQKNIHYFQFQHSVLECWPLLSCRTKTLHSNVKPARNLFI